MARKPDIQYVTQFYIHGSEAPAIELEPARRKRKSAKTGAAYQPARKIRVLIDPMALCGIVVAVVMVVLMAVGVWQYMDTCERYENMISYVIDLQNENVGLKQTYKAGYDPADIQEKALAIGMIPIEEAEVVYISEYVPVEEPQTSIWEEISWFLKGLFA